MKSFFKKIFGAACIGLSLGALQAEPSADELLKAVRDMSVSQGEKDVQGQIRKGRTKIPFGMSVRKGVIVFQYKLNDVWNRFDLHIKAKGVDIMEVKGGKAAVLPVSKYATPLAGTDVCYEDMSLRFLYWKGGVLEDAGEDARIKGRDCWVVRIQNPTKSGQFAWVRVWIDKENGTTWQIDGYGADGELKKRFSITSVQKLKDGSWFFKQMKLEVRDPKDSSRTVALDYIEMDDLPGKK